jgi:hypothetical protein
MRLFTTPFFAAVALCSRVGLAAITLARDAIDLAVAAVCDVIPSAQRFSFTLPSLAGTAGPIGSSFTADVDRHEARFHRRSAARNT